jgi:hypothetical protein
MRAEDILTSARYLRKTSSYATKAKIQVTSVGAGGVPALHAAALEPDLFGQVEIRKSLISYAHLIQSGISRNQLQSLVHGALKVYDLPELAGTLAGRVTITEPVDAMGEVVKER